MTQETILYWTLTSCFCALLVAGTLAMIYTGVREIQRG